METNPDLQKQTPADKIAIKGTVTRPDKVGSAKDGEVRVPRDGGPQRPLPERAG